MNEHRFLRTTFVDSAPISPVVKLEFVRGRFLIQCDNTKQKPGDLKFLGAVMSERNCVESIDWKQEFTGFGK